jgi:cytidylate kinase
LLDAVVWLEAPDEVLLDRINAREKHHRMKGGVDSMAREALARSRATYELALRRLEASDRSPTILRFDTSRQATDEIVEAILGVIRTR